jgi:AraC family transcriptional regulator
MRTEAKSPGDFFGATVRHRQVEAARLVEKVHVAGETLPMHVHRQPFLTFVCAGGYRERAAGETTACGPGTLVVHPAGESHEDTFGDRSSRLVSIEPDRGALGERAWAALDRRAVLSGAAIGRLMGSVRRELARDDELSGLAVLGLLLELSAEVLREPQRRSNRARPPAWLREARRLVLERFRESLRLGDLAAEVGVHPSHLAREFRRHFGTSIGELVRSARIEHAVARMSHSAIPLADLAAECGFADQSHFTRCFRQAVGVPLAAWRGAGRSGRPAAAERST